MSVRLFRDAAAPGTGGGISLASILPSENDPQPGDTGGIEPGTDSNTPPPLPDPVTPVEGLNPDGSLQEGYEKDAEGKVVKKATTTPTPVEGLNADGTVQEGYIKDAQGNVVKDPNHAAVPEEGDFFEEVDKITGRKYEITYPEGVEADTPAGVAHRENVIRENAQIEFERHLQTTDPRGYAYLLHRAAGRPDEEFFGNNTGFVLPTVEEMDASADLQKSVYTYSLKAAGRDQDEIDALVESAIKANKLKDRATAAWNAVDTDQKQQLELLQKEKETKDREFETSVTNFTRMLSNVIEKEMGFVVADTNKKEFEKYVLDNVRYDNGKFFVVQELGQELKTTVEALFLQYKKGDLSTIVTRKAKTEAAQRLKLKTGGSGPTPGSGQTPSPSGIGYIPLGQII